MYVDKYVNVCTCVCVVPVLPYPSVSLLWLSQFRAIDAAGNRDLTFENRRNVYSWRYTPPLPWLLIILAILFFIAICVAAFIYYRKRQRRLQLERYALKRARRKLKVEGCRACGVRGGVVVGESHRSVT